MTREKMPLSNCIARVLNRCDMLPSCAAGRGQVRSVPSVQKAGQAKSNQNDQIKPFFALIYPSNSGRDTATRCLSTLIPGIRTSALKTKIAKQTHLKIFNRL